MALVLKKLYLGYNQIFVENADPRTQDLWGIPSLPILLGFIGLYVYFVQNLGQRLMKNRAPFDIRILLIVYNSLQIVLNLWFAYESSYIYWRFHEGCLPVDYTTSAFALNEVAIVRKYFWLKIFDGLDTIFFVLRKSHRQISFLHVYHHAAMIFVHGVMFSYYLLTCIDSSWGRSEIFKRTLTQMQMVQFIALIIIYGRALRADCTFPKFPSYAMTTQATFMFIMFFDFYRKEYLSANKKERKVRA
ncbi:hypothetical protein JTB14_012735 [Gonioctena quinquepunctata]|nr:hypothetical protein JTB14_012735 [Gonioctena quinquepunctata]